MKNGQFLKEIHRIVDDKVNELALPWERYNQYVKSQKPYHTWKWLSMQSYIGSDLLIDFWSMTEKADKGEDFSGELWIRDNGTHLVITEEERKNVLQVFGEPIFKVKVAWDLFTGFAKPEFNTEGCVNLNLTEEQKILACKVDMDDFNESIAEQECLRKFRQGRKGKNN